MYFYLQLQQAVRAQTGADNWVQSFDTYLKLYGQGRTLQDCRNLQSRCYYMLLIIFLKELPSRTEARWEHDVGTFEEEQWEKALQAIQMCSLNATQRLSVVHLS